MKNKYYLLLTLFPLLAGCSLTPSTPSGGDPTPTPEPDPTDKGTTDKKFLEFFNPNSDIHIKLKMSNEALKNFKKYSEGEGNSNFLENEMYHPANAVIIVNDKQTVLDEVGIRMKGNTSRDTDFVDDNGHFDTNHLCHFKISFSQTFEDKSFYYVHDWTNDEEGRVARDDRKFASMKKLDLKWNRNDDNTFTKEAYALDAFRKEGVLAQHCNLVKFTLESDNDSFTEVYQALEAVDKRLLKNANSDDNKGDLYKCTYTDRGPANLKDFSNDDIGLEGPNYRPIYDLKTNEKNNDFSLMKEFIRNTKKTKKSDDLDGVAYFTNISNYLDVDNFLRYSALCWVFGLPDDLRNNYNNYYIYFNKSNKALFIPYDNDRCIGIRNGWDKDLSNKAWNHADAVGQGRFNECPLVLRLLSGGSNNSHPVHEASQNKYHEYCVDYAAKYLDVNKFQEFTNGFINAPSKDISNPGTNNDSFATYASAKKATLK